MSDIRKMNNAEAIDFIYSTLDVKGANVLNMTKANMVGSINTIYRGQIAILERYIIPSRSRGYYFLIPKKYNKGTKEYDLTKFRIGKLESCYFTEDTLKDIKTKQWNKTEDIKYYYDINKLHIIYDSKTGFSPDSSIPAEVAKGETFDTEDWFNVDDERKRGDTDPFNKFNKREYACIHLRVPDSGNAWLDELIKKSLSSTT